MPGTSAVLFNQEPQLPNQIPSHYEPPAIPASYRTVDVNIVPATRPLELGAAEPAVVELETNLTEPIELSSNAPQPMEPGANLFRRRAFRVEREVNRPSFRNPAQDLAMPEAHSIPDLPELNEGPPTQFSAPETVPFSKTASQYSPHLTQEHIIPAITSRIQQRQSPIITFHCSTLISCKRHCSCICHSKRRYKSPGPLSGLIGSFFVGYTGLPASAPKCNSSTCVNQVSRDFRASYTFPAWFMMKTLDFAARSSFTTGPSFGLSVRNRINMSAGRNILTLALTGDKSEILKLLETKKASLNDVESVFGYSPFQVSMPRSKLYKLSLECRH